MSFGTQISNNIFVCLVGAGFTAHIFFRPDATKPAPIKVRGFSNQSPMTHDA